MYQIINTHDTEPALTNFSINSSEIEASSWDSLKAVSKIP